MRTLDRRTRRRFIAAALSVAPAALIVSVAWTAFGEPEANAQSAQLAKARNIKIND